MNIFIVGLRRSGTTIFWSSFREHNGFVGYDEPFTEQLMYLPSEDPKGTWREFIVLYERDAAAFWHYYAPIHPADELRSGLGERQVAYIRWLLDSDENVVIDFTRCSYKLAALHALDPTAALIHLHRSPAAVATSHLLPARADLRGRLKRLQLMRTFWTRSTGYNNWNFEAIIGRHATSPFGMRLAEIGLDPAQIFTMPAVGRLLAFWLIHFKQVEQEGPALFGKQFVSVNFERFASQPRATVNEVWSTLELPPGTQLPRVHAPNSPFQAGNPRWDSYARILGLPYLRTVGDRG